jgi:hypothetical protein
MKTFLLLLSLVAPFNLTAGFHILREKECIVHYDATLNPFSVEYIVNLVKTIDRNLPAVFGLTNRTRPDLYLYNDRVRFMQERSLQWWENFQAVSNRIYLNNVDLLLEKNFLQPLVKFLVYKVTLSSLYQDKAPEWLITGLAVLYADKSLFPNRNIKFTDFPAVISRLNGYTSPEELDQVLYYCSRGVKYIIDNYTEKGLVYYLEQVRGLDEFKSRFIDLAGMTYSDFMHLLLAHLK